MIGCVLVRDLYICLAVAVFPDPHSPVKQSSFPPLFMNFTPSSNAADS